MKSRTDTSRRKFLSNVGCGMLVASVGTVVATDLGLARAAEQDDGRLVFGELEPLVALMQETPVEKLQPALVEQLGKGTDLKTLIAAGALANARSFGGQDYTGYHALMALLPAWQMAQELSSQQKALPVLKVLYRNTARIQQTEQTGQKEVLRPVPSKVALKTVGGGRLLQTLMRKGDMQGTEAAFAGLMTDNPYDSYNDLQHIVQEQPDVHRVVLAWRAWDILQLTGEEYARPLLRQSVRYCVDKERGMISRGREPSQIRTLLPRLLDEYELPGSASGKIKAEAKWVDDLAREIFAAQPASAAEAVAAVLSEGFDPEAVGEAISLAANALVLHDPGRAKARSSDKPVGSTHGASVGVHASDSANAWRNIARVTNARNRVASLIVGAYHTAGQKGRVKDQPYLTRDEVESVGTDEDQKLVHVLREAVEASDQARAAAVVQRWSDAGHPSTPIFNVLRQYAVSEDGALHAEKYFRTVSEEFSATRREYRWRHLVALARVTASQYVWPAPGSEQARELLRV
jgi:hypothetical protein